MIPLKLVFVLPSMKAGGGNRVFVELCNAIADNFQNVSIYYANNSTERSHYIVSDKVDLVPVGRAQQGVSTKIANVLALMSAINALLKADDKTIVVISDPILCIFYTFFGNRHHERVIRFVQADDFRIYDDLHLLKKKALVNLYKKLCKMTFANRYNYIFNSKYTYEQFITEAKREVPLHLVHPGINTDIFRVKKAKPAHGINICIIARKHPWKGFIDFLKALDNLNTEARKKIGNVTIISHDDLSAFNISSDFTIMRPESDNEIADAMNNAHIFISTSWWEGFGLPPLEAMACGCAVISSNSKGILEYAVDNKNIILYQPKIFSQLCSKLELLIEDSLLREKISSQAIIDSKAFTWKNAADQFASYINTRYGTK